MEIVFRDVCVSYQEGLVLRDISLTLTERRIGIIGPNGSGKITFSRLVNGLVKPSSGSVHVEGCDTRTETRMVRKKVGFVFQNPDNQIVFPIVSEDLAFGPRNHGLSPAEARARSLAILRSFGLEHLAERPSHTLSGGEKQMVALAAVLVMAPRMIVFDEPTTLLDLRHRNQIRMAIAALEQSAIVVTHDLDLVRDFDRVLVFDGGRIVCDDRPEQAIQHYLEHYS